jgi:pyruvate/2-oxoglutarate dehydrogenase complex dihydrolipoamide acyltransferase (E2) component
MPLFRRHEGTFLAKAPVLRRLMPHLMPTRNEAVVYFEQQIEVARATAFVDRLNAERPGRKVTLFQIVLFAMVRTLAARADLNRFVVGRRLYQRNGIELSFAVKKEMTDKATLTTVKVRFDANDTLESALAKIEARIGEGRGKKKLQSETEMDIITLLPRSIVRFVVWLQSALDYFNLLPAALIDGDPLYASMFLANLGSVGLDSAYHHLYEYGTVPFFATIGREKKAVVVGEGEQPVVRDVVSIKYSFDERINDGLYCARSLEIFKHAMEDPESLERPLQAP